MKKLIFPALLLALMGAATYLYLQWPEAEYSYESFISSDAQIVVTQYDLEQRVEEFRASPLGAALNSLDYELIGRELNLSESDLAAFLDFRQRLADLFDNHLFTSLFGREVTFALFPFSYSGARRLEEQLFENLLIIARPVHGAMLIDAARWFDFSSQTMSTSRYGRHTITRYDLEDGRRISGVRMNDLLVLSFNETVLRRSLDVFDGEDEGLVGSDSYREHIDRFSGASLIAYADFPSLYALLEDISTHALDGHSTMTLDDKNLAAYRTGLFGAWRENGRIVDRALITFAPDLLDEQTGKRLEIPVRMPRSHQRVDRETILYHWTNQFDLGYLVRRLPNSGAAGFAENSPLGTLLNVTGLSHTQLAGLFTGTLTLAVKGIDENQLVPLPLFLISATSSDIDRLRSSTDQMIEHFSIPVRREQLGDTGELISWGGIVGIGSLLPAFAFHNDYLVISSSRGEIRNYVGTGEHETLVDREQFKRVSDDILKPSNSITYIEFSELTKMIKEMAEWAATMIAIKDRQLAETSKVLNDELVIPLLDGLAMYHTIASRKYIENNTIHFESQTILDYGNQ